MQTDSITTPTAAGLLSDEELDAKYFAALDADDFSPRDGDALASTDHADIFDGLSGVVTDLTVCDKVCNTPDVIRIALRVAAEEAEALRLNKKGGA